MKRKRTGFAIGIMLLMGGWGLTWYAHEQQQIASVGSSRAGLWMTGGSGATRTPEPFSIEGAFNISIFDVPDSYPSRWIYAVGIMLMTVGAGATAFNLPLPESWK